MLFETHCHSWHSKGEKIPWECSSNPRDLIRRAKRLGLSGIALTDHNTTKGWDKASKEAKRIGLVFIPGVELKTGEGHLIALGISEDIESYLPLDETIERIHEQGGLAIAPHPFDLKGDGIKNGIEKADVVEVFNAMNLDKLSNRVAEKRAKELSKPMIVGSDAHSLDMIGYAVNISEATDMDSFLDDVKQGKLMFRTEYLPLRALVEWYRERLICSYVDVLRYVNNSYIFPKAVLAKTLLNRFVRSKNVSWEILAKFGVEISRIYSMLKIFTY